MKQLPLVSDQITRAELTIILRELNRVLQANVPGSVVELGCYEGIAALFVQQQLLGTGRVLHVYDSFAGLPPKTAPDQSPAGTQFKAGELHASKAKLIAHFKHAGLPLPVIHKGWFQALTTADVPSPIAFAFLDGDFYQSILTSLQLVWPKMSPGGVIVIDDYHTEALPGVRRAVETWQHTHNFTVRTQASLAIIQL